MNGKTLCLMNNKGGVGKSTSTGAFAEILASLNKKVLIVDCDPQGNCSQLFRMYRNTEKTIINLFLLPPSQVKAEAIQECIYKTDLRNIDIIPSNEDFTFTCDEISRDNTRIQQLILKRALSTVKEFYDFIIIDNSPFFNIISINSLCASDYVVTPVESDGYSYTGLVQLLQKINAVRGELNEELQFLGVFLNKAQVTTTLAKNLYRNYQDELSNSFIPVFIRLDNKAKESATRFVPLIKYCPSSNAATDYKRLLAHLHILDAESQKALSHEVIKSYLPEIDELKKRIKSGNSNEITRFRLDVLESNYQYLRQGGAI